MEKCKRDDCYLFYDKKYIAPGYFITNVRNGKIVNFLKIYITNNYGFPEFAIRAFEVNSRNDSPEQEFNNIVLNFKEEFNSDLFKIIEKLSSQLSGKVSSISKSHHGRNNFYLEKTPDGINMIFAKDVYKGTQHPTRFVDINIGDNYTCDNYEAILSFYKDLSSICVNSFEEEDLMQINNLFKKRK